MLSQLSKLLTGLAGRLRSRKGHSRSQKSPIRPRAEPLEERLALSFYVPAGSAAPAGCSCPFCTGQAYAVAGSTAGAAFQTPGYKWAQASAGAPITITYSYSNLLDGGLGGNLPAGTIKAAIQEALSRWASVAPLTFVEKPDVGPAPSSANYDGTNSPMIRFGHIPIDGPYNVLAYGYYPGTAGISGDVQFDQGESWSVNPGAGIDLLEVATHEIGHALGLAHQPAAASGGTDAIMNPVYASRYRGLGTSFLYADDVGGIRAVYGAGAGAVYPLGTAPATPTTPVAPNLQAYLTGPATVLAGNQAVLTFTGLSSGQRYSYDFNNDGVWDVGNGTFTGSTSTTSVTVSASLTSTPRTLTARGRAVNTDGTFRDSYVTVQVTTRAPTVALPASATIGQTDHLLVGGSFADADSRGWTVTADYGDGTGARAVERVGNAFILDHGFTGSGTFTVVVYVKDDSGATGAAQMSVTVTPASSQVLFVDNLFRQVLGRDASAAEEANYAAALQRGVAASVIVGGVWNSDEARSGRLAEYYRTILGRTIDAGGLNSWLGNMRAGLTDEDIIKALVASPEFIAATPNNADFVGVVFKYVLGRDTDASGLASWTANLDRGMTRADLVLNVLRSAERQTNLLSRYFEQYLGRPVTTADLNAWRPGSNPNLTVTALATTILASREFQTRTWWV